MEGNGVFGQAPPEAASEGPSAFDAGTRQDLVRAAEDAGEALEQLYRIGNTFISRTAQERPYAVVGVAAGIGFMLGGGLAWRMAGRLAGFAGRFAIARALEDWIASTSKANRT